VADELLSQWLPVLTLAEKEAKADEFAVRHIRVARDDDSVLVNQLGKKVPKIV
jgi:hypothetical protein